MKLGLISAVLALTGCVAVADAATTGVVDLQYRDIDAGGSDVNGIGYGGAVSAGLAGDWNVQFEAHGLRLDASSPMTMSNGGAHLFYSGGNWRLGGVFSAENYSGAGLYALGVDGQYNFDRASLTGQITYNDVDGSSSSVWKFAGRGRYFFTDDFSANLHYARLEPDGSFLFSDSLDTYGVGGEYKFATGPVSLFADYQVADPSNSATEIKTLSFGVRYAFGEGSLLDREKSGPSLIQNAIIADDVY